MKLSVLNIKGKSTGREVKLSKDIFGIEPNEHAQYLDVKNHLALTKDKEMQRLKKEQKLREVLENKKTKRYWVHVLVVLRTLYLEEVGLFLDQEHVNLILKSIKM